MRPSFLRLIPVLIILFIFSGCRQVSDFTRATDGILIKVQSRIVRLHVLDDRIIRVEVYPSATPPTRQSLVVSHPDTAQVSWDAKKENNSVIVTTASLQVKADLSTGQLQFLDSSGNSLLQENGREIKSVTVAGEKTYSIGQKFALEDHEALYGLGQHQEGNMNLRGKTVDLYQINMKVSVPVLVSTRGYGILWDNYSLSKFTDDPSGMELWSEAGDGIDYYFIGGKSVDDVISGYRNLTGQAPLYARWAYGFFQSKERYQTQEEIVGTVAEFRKRRIPLDVIVQDWYYWEPLKWGSHYMNQARYPDPLKMNKVVHDNNAKIIISVWAKFDSSSSNYLEMRQNGFLWKTTFESSRYYNPYNPQARQLYWKQMHDSLYVKGFDGWWLDASEPEIGDLRKDEIKQVIQTAQGSGVRYLNTYSLMTTGAVYNGQRQTTAEKRVYILTRSAFAGQQRNAATTWSGDIIAGWDVFRKQIAAGLNFCFTGIPYWTTDIGGFTVQVPGGYKNDMYKELFTRWYQYGAFCPIFRVHGSSTPREMWRFGDAGSWSYDAQLKFDNLRYRLMPYIYSLAWKVTHGNYTIMRGLAFDFAKDSNVYNIDDQFMFGPALLVNPVTKAMYYPWIAADSGSVIPAENLVDLEGKPGLTGEYYQDMNFKKLFASRPDPRISFNWGNDAPLQGMPADTFSIRWRGLLVPPETGEYILNTISDDGTRLYINDRLVLESWQDQAPLITAGKIYLQAGKKYKVKLDYYENRIGAVAQLRWIKPSEQKRIPEELPEKSREVYLPQSTRWIDFWTGKSFEGGQKIIAPAPIEIMPLYVKAGSIIPLGPFIQYAAEKPAGPLELRIYPGADGEFELYEDENDNYNYEKGAYATVKFNWNDQNKTLTIGKRNGAFAGMPAAIKMNLVLIADQHGTGVDLTARPDKTVTYTGEKLVISNW